MALFGISDCQHSNAMNKIGNITIDNVFTTKKHLIVIFIEEMKPVDMSENEFGYREKLSKVFFGNFGLLGFSSNGQNTSILFFHLNTLLQVLPFRLSFFGGAMRACRG